MSNTVIVKNIAQATEDKEIKDFFSFCGKISDIQIKTTGETKEATVVFDKETAAKTALLLNNSQLGQNSIEVKSATGDQSDDGSHFAKAGERAEGDDVIRQEEKPRSRILAEYLAHGYVVGDVALERAIELDHKHGVTSRFLSTLQGLDQKYHATDRARATDQSYGLTARAGNFLSGLGSYFEKATNTPTGKKIVQFYEEGSRQVQDIHAEARRLADLKTEQAGGSAYKAAGLEKVFGKEKEKTAEAAPAAAPAADGAKPAETEAAPKV